MKFPPFFQRGSGPLVSVLIPTRNRVNRLQETLQSFISTSSDINSIEFVLKIDDDDLDTIDFVSKLEASFNLRIKKIISPRGAGYSDLHIFSNRSAQIANGDWLFIFNDDAKMLTKGWDALIANTIIMEPYYGIDKLCILYPNDVFSFCFIRKSTFNILGHLAEDCLVDRWIYDIVCMVHHVIRIEDIEIGHKNDDIMEETKSKSYSATSGHILTYQQKQQKVNDCQIVLDYLVNAEKDAILLDKPDKFGWWIWKLEETKIPIYIEPSGACHTFVDRKDLLNSEAKWTFLH